jgi:hypothetical protein
VRPGDCLRRPRAVPAGERARVKPPEPTVDQRGGHMQPGC